MVEEPLNNMAHCCNDHPNFRMNHGLLIERIDDQVLVFNTKTNLPYIMNSAAAFILTNTDGDKSQEKIAEMLCEEFDVDFHQALEDIRMIYRDLIGKDLIIRIISKLVD
jgi:hypothetical protein